MYIYMHLYTYTFNRYILVLSNFQQTCICPHSIVYSCTYMHALVYMQNLAEELGASTRSFVQLIQKDPGDIVTIIRESYEVSDIVVEKLAKHVHVGIATWKITYMYILPICMYMY